MTYTLQLFTRCRLDSQAALFSSNGNRGKLEEDCVFCDYDKEVVRGAGRAKVIAPVLQSNVARPWRTFSDIFEWNISPGTVGDVSHVLYRLCSEIRKTIPPCGQLVKSKFTGNLQPPL